MISAHRKKTPSKLPELGESLNGVVQTGGLIGFLHAALPFLRRSPQLEQAYRRVGSRVMEPEPHRTVRTLPSDPKDFQDTVPEKPHGWMTSNSDFLNGLEIISGDAEAVSPVPPTHPMKNTSDGIAAEYPRPARETNN